MQSACPFFNGAVSVNGAAIDIVEGFDRQSMALFLLFDRCCQRLFHDPTARALQAGGNLIHLFRKRQWHMGCHNLGVHRDGSCNQT